MKLITQSRLHKSIPLGLIAILAGCGGDDGSPGNPGEPGGPPATEIVELNIAVKDVAFDAGTATINYRITNEQDEPVVGIPSATYIAAQLLPMGYTNAGNASQWQYFTSESCSDVCDGELVDHKNGQYSYTFSGAFDGMNDIEFMPGATQRVVIKVGGDALPDGTALPITNQHHDWQDKGSEPVYTRNLIEMETCNSCHNDLAFHGSKYNEVETCVTCHNTDKVSNPDNVFAPMVHSKHLTGFPGSLADCQTCHAANEALTENMNWARVPTMEACGSCHTNIDFPAGQGHPTQQDNSNCVACHNSEWTMSAHSQADTDAVLGQFNVEIVSAMLNGTTVELTVRLSNPATNEIYTESANELNFVNDLRIYANWGVSVDYTTRSARSIKLQETVPISGSDGLFTYQISGLTVPSELAADKGTLAIQGKLCSNDDMLASCTDTDNTTNLKSSHQFFNASTLSDTGRRVVVTNETCGSCHGDQQLNYHGSRNDLEGQCQVCHNRNMQAETSADNPAASTADYKHLVHTLHAGSRESYPDITYPGNIGNCAQCHTQDDAGVLTAALPLDSAVQPLAFDDGSFTSPTSAICSACHTSDTSKGHMTQQGGVFNGSEADATSGTESCATCHGQGASVDVLAVHPIK
ncbi:OmcA/MtrC family decaheme c-type cytochrome [Shewanella sp. KX20019]|uniref:OmcA/MtrC family decaheme c-type cytochrome n=1 Tax=Shewanella sp. KX20019 TaxID=2803864 RepID=UPI0019268545|nr:OmcA/MtrC family decaheme c-type cytochrome [Shewanella sp. KX20019]QQX78867.1 OmcA/MtrC family decaheme c-type cytochrome [Shewanella sp. KX20019]